MSVVMSVFGEEDMPRARKDRSPAHSEVLGERKVRQEKERLAHVDLGLPPPIFPRPALKPALYKKKSKASSTSTSTNTAPVRRSARVAAKGQDLTAAPRKPTTEEQLSQQLEDIDEEPATSPGFDRAIHQLSVLCDEALNFMDNLSNGKYLLGSIDQATVPILRERLEETLDFKDRCNALLDEVLDCGGGEAYQELSGRMRRTTLRDLRNWETEIRHWIDRRTNEGVPTPSVTRVMETPGMSLEPLSPEAEIVTLADRHARRSSLAPKGPLQFADTPAPKTPEGTERFVNVNGQVVDLRKKDQRTPKGHTPDPRVIDVSSVESSSPTQDQQVGDNSASETRNATSPPGSGAEVNKSSEERSASAGSPTNPAKTPESSQDQETSLRSPSDLAVTPTVGTTPANPALVRKENLPDTQDTTVTPIQPTSSRTTTPTGNPTPTIQKSPTPIVNKTPVVSTPNPQKTPEAPTISATQGGGDTTPTSATETRTTTVLSRAPSLSLASEARKAAEHAAHLRMIEAAAQEQERRRLQTNCIELYDMTEEEQKKIGDIIVGRSYLMQWPCDDIRQLLRDFYDHNVYPAIFGDEEYIQIFKVPKKYRETPNEEEEDDPSNEFIERFLGQCEEYEKTERARAALERRERRQKLPPDEFRRQHGIDQDLLTKSGKVLTRQQLARRFDPLVTMDPDGEFRPQRRIVTSKPTSPTEANLGEPVIIPDATNSQMTRPVFVQDVTNGDKDNPVHIVLPASARGEVENGVYRQKSTSSQEQGDSDPRTRQRPLLSGSDTDQVNYQAQDDQASTFTGQELPSDA